MRSEQRAIDAKLITLRMTDPLGATACEMVWKGVCPACGRYALTVTGEDAVNCTRTFACSACRWTVTVVEAVYRGDPAVTLRSICKEAKRTAKPLVTPRTIIRASTARE